MMKGKKTMVYNDDEHGDDAKENGVWMNFLCEKKGETNKKKIYPTIGD